MGGSVKMSVNRVDSFLKKMGIAPELTNIYETAIRFQNEMKAGLEGKASSLPMIPSYIDDSFNPIAHESVIAIDAGGTHLRIALVQFDEKLAPKIKEIKFHPMPGSTTCITSDDFFDFLAIELEELLKETRKIGFCFTFLVEILPCRDGKILEMGKEVKIVGCEGKIIGQELSKALDRKSLPNFSHITVLDDTTASLISGKWLYKDQDYADVIAAILGTGTNLCYFEKNNNIHKSPLLVKQNGKTIINIESGCFDGQVKGQLDLEFWSETLQPESHHTEKMIAGQYLGSLLEKYFAKAIDCQLFSKTGADIVRALGKIETKNINDYLAGAKDVDNSLFTHSLDIDNPLHELQTLNQEDLSVANALIEALVERAAKLFVSSLLGCLLQINPKTTPNRPALILVEGSTFLRFTALQEKVKHYVEIEVEKKQGFYVIFKQIDHAVILGTACAATLS